jgi:hypothetical protein
MARGDAEEGKRCRTGVPQVDFSQIVIEYLKTAGIHQSDKGGKIDLDGVAAWPGQWIGAEGRFRERDEMRRAAILIGPEYGTLSRPDLTAAAHAYFLGANDPYKALKAALRAEIDEEVWSTLYSATSRPFPRPRDGVIAVKVINHFGDEVMKVYRV